MCMKLTHVGLVMSVCMIQLENRWTDFDEICDRRYAIGDFPFNFL
jgi:hypothetical protein